MAIQKLKPLKHFCMTIGELPSSYVETMSYYEMILWFINYLKREVISAINNNAEILQELKTIVDDIEVNFEDLQNQINGLDEKIESEIHDLNIELNQKILNFKNDCYNKINEEVAILNDKIDDISLQDVNVYNPTNGLIENIQKVINDIYNADRLYAITCSEFDSLELTANEFDTKEISAYDFDNYAKELLNN